MENLKKEREEREERLRAEQEEHRKQQENLRAEKEKPGKEQEELRQKDKKRHEEYDNAWNNIKKELDAAGFDSKEKESILNDLRTRLMEGTATLEQAHECAVYFRQKRTKNETN